MSCENAAGGLFQHPARSTNRLAIESNQLWAISVKYGSAAQCKPRRRSRLYCLDSFLFLSHFLYDALRLGALI